MANEQTYVSRVADREELPLLLDKARRCRLPARFRKRACFMSLNFHSHREWVRSLGATHRERRFYPTGPDIFRRR
jgi:hypothetical protein